MLSNAYVDIYLLKEIEKYNESVQNSGQVLPKSSHNVLGHFCELLKADLGLTLWKLYFDTNSKSNSISHLETYIRMDCGINLQKNPLPKGLRDAGQRLSTLRNDFLAHNDRQKKHESIQLPEMIAITEHIRQTLNKMCFPKLDSRATELTNQHIIMIQFQASLGLGLMIHSSSFPEEESAKRKIEQKKED